MGEYNRGRWETQYGCKTRSPYQVMLPDGPELSFLARGQIAFIEDLEVLRSLIVKMSTAHTIEEAQQRLLEVGRGVSGH